MRAALAALIVAVLAAGAVAAVVHDEGGPMDQAGAEACGTGIVEDLGARSLGVSANRDGSDWRISVATETGVLGAPGRRPGP